MTLSAEPLPEGQGVRVSVSDDGPGIAKEKISELFDKFVQVNRSNGPGYKGTGLGLAICKEIIGLHGSAIEVESLPGSGTRFSFTLPLAPPSGVLRP